MCGFRLFDNNILRYFINILSSANVRRQVYTISMKLSTCLYIKKTDVKHENFSVVKLLSIIYIYIHIHIHIYIGICYLLQVKCKTTACTVINSHMSSGVRLKIQDGTVLNIKVAYFIFYVARYVRI
jgi:hypothetical protein